MSVNVKRFYAPSEIDAELLDGVVDETEPRHREMLDFVQLITHDTTMVELQVIINQVDDASPLAGFAERTPRNKGLEATSRFVNPYHIKDGYDFDVESDYLNVSEAGEVTISREGVAFSADWLEQRRTNRLVEGLMAMLDAKQFTYKDEDKLIEVPYDHLIGDLAPPSTALNDAGAEPYFETDTMKSNYKDQTKQKPNLAFISDRTAAMFKKLAEVKQVYAAQQSSDPDNFGDTFEMFRFNGVLYVVMDHDYALTDGTLAPAVKYGRAIVTVDRLAENGQSPIQLHKSSTKLNHSRPERPWYDFVEESKDPPAGFTRLYDNMLPNVGKKNAVMHWQMWPDN